MSALEDKCYAIRNDVTWTDLKKAMSRVKKLRKQGVYLIVEHNDDASHKEVIRKTYKNTIRSPLQTFTVRVMGPRNNVQEIFIDEDLKNK